MINGKMIRRKSKLSFTIWEWKWIVKSNDKLSAIGDRDLNTTARPFEN